MRTKVNVCAVFLPISLNYYPFLSVFAHEAHTKTRAECTRMAVIVKLPSGAWRVQVRRKKIYSSKTFIRHSDATSWALETERAIDQGLDLKSVGRGQSATFGEVIDLHIKDMQEIGKPLGRSKNAVLAALKKSVGKTALKNMTRETLISYGKRRAKLGAGPATLAIDFSFISTVLTHAAALYGIATSTE